MSKSNNFSGGTRTHMVRRDAFFSQKIKLPEYLIFPVCGYLSCDLLGNDSTPEIADKLPTAKKNLPWWIFLSSGYVVVTICSSALLPSETLSPRWVPAWATPPCRSSLLSFRAFEKRKDKTNLKHPFLLISPVPFLV